MYINIIFLWHYVHERYQRILQIKGNWANMISNAKGESLGTINVFVIGNIRFPINVPVRGRSTCDLCESNGVPAR